MDHSQLLEQSLQLLKEFNPVVASVDTHADEFFQTHEIFDPDDQEFLHQVFYGATRYEKMLKMATTVLFESEPEALITDEPLYRVLLYLFFFRLDELGTTHFVQFLKTLATPKCVTLLRFMTDDDHKTRRECGAAWLHVFDAEYVENDLMANWDASIPPIQEFRQSVEAEFAQTTAASAPSRASTLSEDTRGKKYTVPQPFEIRQPKAKVLPPPEEIQTEFKAKEAPRTKRPKELATERGPFCFLDARTKEKNDARVKTLRETAKAPTFGISSEEDEEDDEEYEDDDDEGEGEGDGKVTSSGRKVRKSSRKMKKKMLLTTEEIELSRIEEEREKLRKEREKDRKSLKIITSKPPPRVRMNAAAILREDALYKKKQEEDAALLQRYEEELHDASAFYEWQEHMRVQDEAERQASIELRKMEIELADLEAREAKERSVQQRIREAKRKRALLEKEIERLRHEREEELSALAAAVQLRKKELAECVEESKQKLLEEKQREADAIRLERKENEIAISEAMEMERQRKEDLIRQIRAMERVPGVKPQNLFDPSKTAGHGLLEEMSLLELYERLASMKEAEMRFLEDRRRKIVEEKKEKQDFLEQKMESIAHFRSAARFEAEKERTAKRQRAEKIQSLKEERRKKRVLEMSERLVRKREAMRAARKRVEDDVREKEIQAQFLAADRDAVEERHFHHQRAGSAREARQREEEKEESRRREEEAKRRSDKQRDRARLTTLRETKKKRAEVDSQTRAGKMEREEFERSEWERKRQSIVKERTKHMQKSKPSGSGGKSHKLIDTKRLKDLQKELAPARYTEHTEEEAS
eukprot:TRINITY_DN80538_c0_g1_i1.p1 TRINITY_DN80538_c0_g1~~TRINITY_DN80538_c0_g1_i1.p1  ORF type:complete len:818 (-),score=331.30 TRINITY_DN80538_c0_g1_i1:62-2515(-)